jgi:hypothetical protein
MSWNHTTLSLQCYSVVMAVVVDPELGDGGRHLNVPISALARILARLEVGCCVSVRHPQRNAPVISHRFISALIRHI